jgi:hypothetical protein
MAKNIVLLSDGTGNSARSTTPTNVGRLYAALSLHDSTKQVAFYDDGVGTERLKFLRIMGGAFGFGLMANVLELYKFLCRTYDEHDKIYLFGFSRGAYTVRVLVGLLDECGLIQRSDFANEYEFNRKVRQNYGIFREKFHRGPVGKSRKQKGELPGKNSHADCPPIEFLGVWDTVDAYGLPIDELAVAWDQYIYPYRFRDRTLSHAVNRAHHAIALDDERHTFHPVLWDEANEKNPARIEQVWFAGVHANVGGGYPDDTLALVSLEWMLSHLRDAAGNNELHLIKSESDELKAREDANGKLYNSRSGLQAYYRYKPRNVAKLCNDDVNDVVAEVKIHKSVFDRVLTRHTAYYPIGIPENFIIASNPTVHNVTSGAQSQPKTTIDANSSKTMWARALKRVWDFVFWRRILYLCFLLTTLAFVATPFVFNTRPETGGENSSSLLSTLLFDLADRTLPEAAGVWIDALRSNPLLLVPFAVLFAAIYAIKLVLQKRAHTHAAVAWSHISETIELIGAPKPDDGTTSTYRLRTLCSGKCVKISNAFLGLFGLVLLIAGGVIALSLAINFVEILK